MYTGTEYDLIVLDIYGKIIEMMHSTLKLIAIQNGYARPILAHSTKLSNNGIWSSYNFTSNEHKMVAYLLDLSTILLSLNH